MRVLAALALCLWAGAIAAQEDPAPAPVSAVLIVDRESLYAESAAGQAIEARIQSEATALQAENDKIQAQLIEEERSLTLRRPSMSNTDFRAEAEAFDTKVQDIRRAQDAKIAELERESQQARDQFFLDVRGIVGQLMLDRGGSVVLDRRLVYLAVGSVDITAEAIARIDASLELPAEEAAPPDAPE